MKKIYFLLFFSTFIFATFFLMSFKSITKIESQKKYHQPFFSTGITGQSTAGCTCHGATATNTVDVNISGMPTNPVVGVTYPLLFNISGTNSYAGFNLTVGSGTLVNSNTESQLSGGELTHTAPKFLTSGTASFAFDWTPTTAGSVTFNYAGNNVNGNGLNNDDFWNIGSVVATVVTLPVKLNAFQGNSINASTNKLFWKVEQEINFSKYEIESSCDGLNFNTIATKIASSGSNLSKDYFYTDVNINCNKTYYRLKMVDLDATFSYSSIISITGNGKVVKPIVYPNPISLNQETVKVNSGSEKAKYITIVDIKGRIIQQYNTINNIEMELVLPKKLLSGTYYVKIMYKNGVQKSIALLVQ
jgi:hypothetical protein